MQLKLFQNEDSNIKEKELLSEKEKNKIKVDDTVFNTEIYDHIMRFLREHSHSSKNTSDAYERDIRDFFQYRNNKMIEHLTREDLVFKRTELKDYQSYLFETLGKSASTTNRNISAISECMKYLFREEMIKKIDFLEVKRLKQVDDSYDELTEKEVDEVVDFVLTTGRKKTGLIKSLLILFCFDTCMRLQECLELKWSDFGYKNKNGKIPVRTVAKGKKVMVREIDPKLYDALLQLKEDGNNKVFNISKSTIKRMMEDIRAYLDIDSDRRRIVFHSIRKAGAQWAWEEYRDINQVSRMLGHSSIQTTELYINKNENYGVLGAISSRYSVDNKLFEKVSHEQLLKAISELDYYKQMSINLKIKDILK